MEYKICNQCVMDSSDPALELNNDGICHHCVSFEQHALPNWMPNEKGQQLLQKTVEKIKRAGRGQDFDCLLGMSGGADSSYMLHTIVQKFGLRPLVYHVDGGWNSDDAVHNIECMVKKLDLDLFTHVIDWKQMADFQLTMFKSGVPHLDIPQDMANAASTFQFAKKYKVKYILNGGNISTEVVRNPKEWIYYGSDMRQIKDIVGQFSTIPLDQFPMSGVFYHKVYLKYILGLKMFKPLNLMPYVKADAEEILGKEYGWRPHKQKHFESRFTAFYEGYWLPSRFGFDVRRVQFSSLILTNQMDRKTAIDQLSQPVFGAEDLEQEKKYICDKLKISVEELEDLHGRPLKSYRDYKNMASIFDIGAKILQFSGSESSIKK